MGSRKPTYVDRHTGTRKVLYVDDALRDGLDRFRRRNKLDWSGAMRRLLREALAGHGLKVEPPRPD